MNHSREDSIYELQQALAELPPSEWPQYLEAHCVDAELRTEVLNRLARLNPGAGEPSHRLVVAADVVSPQEDFPAWLDGVGYDLLGEVGRGGMGIVYRVRDRSRRQVVALKTLQTLSPASLVRFKQEFRVLADVSHHNLACLYDVISDGARWCFTMEFIDGVDFLTFVRGGLPAGAGLNHAQLERLHGALKQLVDGLSALHSAGKLHRDVKPTNVLVTAEGRVVIVDFGLTAELGSAGLHQSTHRDLTGTVAYMSPEHVSGQPLAPASDWYSVGVMLFEALTGQLPFDGPIVQVLKSKVGEDAPSPSSRTLAVPSELDDLCTQLLRRDYRNRPSPSVFAGLRGSRHGTDVEPPQAQARSELVGRESHLRELTLAFQKLSSGRPALTLVSGRSGVGKTALLQHFVATVAAKDGALVLSGRCFEQESVPYKALDGAIDALAKHLGRMPESDVRVLLPRDVGPLTRVFPVFLTVRAFVDAPTSEDVQDPRELRRRAFSGLRELMARLGDRRRVVLAIDDLQWGDLDSIALIAELLRPPDPAVIMVVGCYREEDEADSVVLSELRTSTAALSSTSVTQIRVKPLNLDEVRDLVSRLSDERPTAISLADAVMVESGGYPFLVQQLLEHLQVTSVRDARHAEPKVVGFEALVTARLSRLTERQRHLLELIAVASRPIEEIVVCDAIGAGSDARSDVAALRVGRLVRMTSASGSHKLETYHDRLREGVRARLSPETLTSRHRVLARALETGGSVDPEVLAVHLHGAGELKRAADLYASAGDRAANALAFDYASRFYTLALTTRGAGMPHDADLRARLGSALANAGRGAQAAQEYLRAAEAHGPDELDLRTRAATQLLISGRVDEGLVAISSVLAAVGMTLPKTPQRAVMALLWRRGLLRLRGWKFRERRADAISTEELNRVDVSWSVAVGLTMVDPIQAAAFQALNARLALRAGEPYRVARALAMEAAHTSTEGTRGAARTRQILVFARDVAERAKHPHGKGLIFLADAVRAYLLANWSDSHKLFLRALEIFRNECVGAAWEIATAQIFDLNTLAFMGRMNDMRSRVAEALRDAHDRDDRYLSANIGSLITPLAELADDQPAAAAHTLSSMIDNWSKAGFYVQHINAVYRQAEVALYLRDLPGAQGYADRLWRGLHAAQLHRVQFFWLNTTHLRMRIALAQAAVGTNRESSLRWASRGARTLQRAGIPYYRALGDLIAAGVATQRRQLELSARLAGNAIAMLDQNESRLYAAAARKQLGAVLGGPHGQKLVDEGDRRFEAESVCRPDSMAAMLVPGFVGAH